MTITSTKFSDAEHDATLEISGAVINQLIKRINEQSQDKLSRKERVTLRLQEFYESMQVVLGTNATLYVKPSDSTAWTELYGPIFKQHLNRLYQQAYKSPVVMANLIEACDQHSLNVDFTKQQQVYNRLAYDAGQNTIYYDLCRDDLCVEIRPAPVPPRVRKRPTRFIFNQGPGVMPLPEPDFSGTITDLEAMFDSIPNASHRMLVIGWVLGTFLPEGNKPNLIVYGPQRSSKSTITNRARWLVDPFGLDVDKCEGMFPSRSDSFVSQAQDSHLLTYGNNSKIPYWLSDLLCQLVTGAMSTERKFYKQGATVTFSIHGCATINSITRIADQPDLLDRSIVFKTSTWDDTIAVRKDEVTLVREFHALHAKALGALINAASVALATVSHDTRESRMIHFTNWVEAGGATFGWRPNTFANTYAAQIAEQYMVAFNDTEIGPAIVKLLRRTKGFWQGTFKYLGECLTRVWDFADGARAVAPRALTPMLERLAPLFKVMGIEYTNLQQHTMEGNLLRLHFIDAAITVPLITDEEFITEALMSLDVRATERLSVEQLEKLKKILNQQNENP